MFPSSPLPLLRLFHALSAPKPLTHSDANASYSDATPPKPNIPNVYSANCSHEFKFNGKTLPGIGRGNTTLSVDTPNKLFYSFLAKRIPNAPKEFLNTPYEWLNISYFRTRNASYVILENNKYSDPNDYTFYNPLGWVHSATFAGTRKDARGNVLHVWTASFKWGTYELLITPSGTPVVLKTKMTMSMSQMPHGSYETTQYYHSFLPNVVSHIWEEFNEDSFRVPPVCQPPGGKQPDPVKQTIYVYHPKNEFNITRQDVADVRGDTYFVCSRLSTYSSDSGMFSSTGNNQTYEWISEWELEWIPRFGQYQNCNGYPPSCLGKENFWVGHEAPLGMGLQGGQCQRNIVGEWFSLPLGGKCAENWKQAPDGKTCSWKQVRRVKTIDVECLRNLGFEKMCKAESRSPYLHAEKIFKRAFALSDPLSGGCPRVGE